MLFRRKKPKSVRENIFLIGPMGAGKTTVGTLLAKSLHRPFVDSDKVIEKTTGATIPLIFEIEGEAGFRKRECQIIDELTRQHPIVLATGGGAILHEDNRRHLKNRGKVVYLQASVDQILARTAHDKNRPLLQTENPRARIEQIMTTREPLYRETADLIISTDQYSLRDVVNEIIRTLVKSNDNRRGNSRRTSVAE